MGGRPIRLVAARDRHDPELPDGTLARPPLDGAAARPALDGAAVARIVLRTGLAIAFVLLVLGTLIQVAVGAPADAVRATQLLSDPSIGDRVLMLGVLVLAATPVVQVLVLLVGWWRVRDYRYALVAGAVMALLAAGVALGVTA